MPTKQKVFDEFWTYPETLQELAKLGLPPTQMAALTQLITEGELEAIEEWLEENKSEKKIVRLIERGMPEDDCSNLFDEIELGTRCFEDGTGTVDYVFTRRVGSKFHHRVYNDFHGDDLYKFVTNEPMTFEQFKNLTTYPAPFEEDGFAGEVANSSVSSVWGDWSSGGDESDTDDEDDSEDDSL